MNTLKTLDTDNIEAFRLSIRQNNGFTEVDSPDFNALKISYRIWVNHFEKTRESHTIRAFVDLVHPERSFEITGDLIEDEKNDKYIF